MKFKILAAAIAAFSGVAVAGPNGDSTVDISGASAIQQNVAKAVLNLCTTAGGTLTVLKGGSATNAFDNRMGYVCSAAMDGGITTVRHSVNGGSLNSILAMGGTNVVQFVNPATCGAPVAGSGPLAGYTVRPGCGNVGARSDGGYSDIEWPLAPEVFASAPAGLLDSLDPIAPAFVGQVFGVGVSKDLYEALQAAQAASLPASCTIGSTTPECQPSINSADVTSLLNNNEFSSAKFAGGGAFGVAENTLTYCKRPNTSGTQTSAEVFFLGKTCATGEVGGAQPVTSVGTFGGGKYVVTENSGSSDVANCLNGSGFRFGVISAENNPVGTANTWRFAKLDNVSMTEGTAEATNRLTAIEGTYKFTYEAVLHTNSNFVVDDGAGSEPITGSEELAFMQAVALGLGTPGSAGGASSRGLFQIPDSGYDNATYPTEVSKVQRGGAAVNNCSPLARP